MQERIRAAMERVDALSVRERGLVFLAALGVLWVTSSELLFEPLFAERDRVASEVSRTRAQTQEIHAQIAELVARRRVDPDAANRDRLAALRKELEEVERSLSQMTKRLVPPEKMAVLLEEMLTSGEGLELVQLESLGASPVLDPSIDGGTMLFRHGLRIEYEGDYEASLRYLSALEDLPWQFLWDSVELEIESRRVSITVHSLSLEQAWIGV